MKTTQEKLEFAKTIAETVASDIDFLAEHTQVLLADVDEMDDKTARKFLREMIIDRKPEESIFSRLAATKKSVNQLQAMLDDEEDWYDKKEEILVKA